MKKEQFENLLLNNQTEYRKLIDYYKNDIIEEYLIISEEQDEYNCFNDSYADKIRRFIFDSYHLKWSYDAFYELKLDKFLGKTYTEKLFKIFLERPESDIHSFIFKSDENFDNIGEYNVEDEYNVECYTLREIKQEIDERIEFWKNYKKKK